MSGMDRANQEALAGNGPRVPPEGGLRRPGPLHRRLADAIEEMIVRGELAPGAVLPTERALGRAAAVSRATAAEAYRRLRAAGRIDSRQGRGTWVTGLPTAAGRAPAESMAPVLRHEHDAIDLALAATSPDADLRDRIADALAGAARRVVGPGYQPAGAPELRARLGDRPDEVVVTSGAQQALSLVMDELVRPGDVVLVEEVTYVGALDAARRSGGRLVAVPTGPDGVDVAALEEAVGWYRPAVVYLNPTHQSPTGSVLADRDRARVVEAIGRAGSVLVDDRTLADLPFDAAPRPRPLRSFDLGARVVTVGSLSKTVWPGLRIGWVRADPTLVARLVQRRIVADLGGDLLAQAVAVRLLDELPQLAAARAAQLARRHAHLVARLRARLPEWQVAPSRGGIAAWVRLPRDDALAVASVAARHGVHVVAGPLLSPHGGVADHLRLVVTPEPDVLTEAVDRLATAWAAHQGRVTDGGPPRGA